MRNQIQDSNVSPVNQLSQVTGPNLRAMISALSLGLAALSGPTACSERSNTPENPNRESVNSTGLKARDSSLEHGKASTKEVSETKREPRMRRPYNPDLDRPIRSRPEFFGGHLDVFTPER